MADEQDHDVVYLHSPTEDGDGVRVVRARQGKVEVGEVRPLAEGKPVTGEIVSLRPRADSPRLCDVRVEYAPAPNALAPGKNGQGAASGDDDGKGPAQVASPRYRENWDAIFGPPKKVAPALN